MKIQSIETFEVAVPLIKPFKTALRTVTTAQSIYVVVTDEAGKKGYGEAPPTHVITGETLVSIKHTIDHILAPVLIGKDLMHSERVFTVLHETIIGNTSAKAALDMAIFDLLAKQINQPLFHYLGGYRDTIETDFTVSVNEPNEMADDAESYVANGFDVLKIKVGIGDIGTDITRIKAIRERVGNQIKLRLDANQGWEAKEAVRAIRQMEDAGLEIELIEQPVIRYDFEGLKYVTNHTYTPIMADESVFSPDDLKRILAMRAADLVNLKLMKSGGIYKAYKMNKMAEAYGVECMVGSMIETKIGVCAAAHFAASQRNITRYDFDAPLMLAEETIDGGIQYNGRVITFPEDSGLGIRGIKGGTLHG
ncbi:dipeptide epimerase [Lysinibacillus sp. LZ02]|uniref:dipeptide epimerase n=1 Tax=Lysinibacillus sp. LZ02 TaxID=3420668 RepID=UPI003D35C28E